MLANACCCGHMPWEHMGSVGHCRVCGPLGCRSVHEVGDGHWPGWFFLFVAALLLFFVYAATKINRRRDPAIHLGVPARAFSVGRP